MFSLEEMGMVVRTHCKHAHLVMPPKPSSPVATFSSSNSLTFSKNRAYLGLEKSFSVNGGNQQRRREVVGTVVASSTNVAAPFWDSWKPDKGSKAPSLSDIVWPSAGAFVAMAVLGRVDQLLAPKGLSVTIAPLGAVCAVLFATPSSPGARILVVSALIRTAIFPTVDGIIMVCRLYFFLGGGRTNSGFRLSTNLILEFAREKQFGIIVRGVKEVSKDEVSLGNKKTEKVHSLQKYNIFMAQIGCAAIGVLAFSIFGPGWVARSSGLAAAIAFMIYAGAVHPPAASLPLLFIDGAKLHHLNFWYALFPGATGCIVLCLMQEVVSYLKVNLKF